MRAPILALILALPLPVLAEQMDMAARFADHAAKGRTGLARKTKPVDARPAQPGEVIVTLIRGEGIETRSKPAQPGDQVVRNRCPQTGNEEYLVSAAKFPDRYEATSQAAGGWREYRPKGQEMGYFIIPQGEGPYTFAAPWGEEMVARAGDAIVGSPADPSDVYRIAAASFACSYEITRAAP
ncbi:MAG: hypothetical protein QM682_03315 [Paracoccus sp. (in: a-proteobacteria)]|uniref:hypothetical protein n=1 Tax=Paracoccus sp. TaxID=267 RepID=UPI0039E6A696